MLSMDRTTFWEFRNDPATGFPEPVAVGNTSNGHPRLRWHKWQVIAWLLGLRPPPPGSPVEPAEPEDAPNPPPRRKS